MPIHYNERDRIFKTRLLSAVELEWQIREDKNQCTLVRTVLARHLGDPSHPDQDCHECIDLENVVINWLQLISEGEKRLAELSLGNSL